MKEKTEVLFHRLRPGQIRERREECPIVFIPLGTLEWHGLHNPMGADGLQAEEMAKRCAMRGGVVFPTVYYGESRVNSLLETDPRYQDGIADRLGIDREHFREDRFPYTGMEQLNHYQQHLTHIIAEAASYGYKLAVFVIGHYPLIEHARSAAVTYNQWAYDKQWKRISVMCMADFLFLRDRYENPGDHAGAWETSHLLASDPETVDLSLARKDLQYGIMTTRDPAGASAEFGDEIYNAAVDVIWQKIEQWKSDPGQYKGHGIRLD